MDLASKKRKADDNGLVVPSSAAPRLTPEDALKILEPFSRDELLSIVSTAMVADPSSSVLSSVRSIADADPSRRKLFIRALGWDTTSDSLRSLFSSFGELEEAIVISDKVTGKSKGYGFITFRHVDGALLALKEPSKKIDGRMTVTQLASAGNTAAGGGLPTGPAAPAPDVALRKIYVGAVPADMPSDRLLALFSSYGEVEEGPLGFDKNTGKFRGYALFVYKHPESARAAVEEPRKFIDGHQITCKFANDGKGKPGDQPANPAVVGGFDSKPGDAPSFPGPMPSQFGGPGSGLSSYGGFSGASGLPGHHQMNSPLQASVGGSQASSALPGPGAGGVGGYGGGLGGPYTASSQFTGSGYPAGSGGYPAGSGGYGGFGMGLSSGLYNRAPPSSGGIGAGMGSGGFPEAGRGYPEGGRGYPDGGPYSMSAKGHSGQHLQQLGSPPRSRVPPGGGMYQGMPPYY
ncbi:UBP1-associated protein 2C [Iris pallida]|uniref:UBP1-associated protein 2C n=1 Tax=Iris pallida TaxID=29817 RepID=A0AAX6IC72_IRIPA|nr:UBP1-associated protein 2C [Iris pallida]